MEFLAGIIELPWALSLIVGLGFSYGLSQWIKWPLSNYLQDGAHKWAVRTVGVVAGWAAVYCTWPLEFPPRGWVGLAAGFFMPTAYALLIDRLKAAFPTFAQSSAVRNVGE